MVGKEVVILYGSATQNAKDVAEQLSRMAANRRFQVANCTSIDAFASQQETKWPTDPVYLFVVSTTGDGAVPANMKQTWQFLLQKKIPTDYFAQMTFAVFGLGDSSYAKYNAAARRLQARLLQLGGKELIPRGLGDDQHELGYFGALNPWISQLWSKLLELYPLPEGFIPDDAPVLSLPKFEVTYYDNAPTVLFDASNSFYECPDDAFDPSDIPIMSKLVSNERITSSNWEQDVRHIELDISSSNVAYTPGSIVVLYPENRTNVDDFIRYLGLNPEHIVKIAVLDDNMKLNMPSICSIRDIMVKYLDILGTPRRHFFEKLSLFATDDEEKEKLLELSSADGADLLHDYCTRERRTYMEALYDFKSCKPSFEYLLELIPKIQPREYSISSSYNLNPGKIHLTIAIVDYLTPYKRKKVGVCSNYLAHLRPLDDDGKEVHIPIFVKRGLFKLPDSSKDIVMIGPGTGLAPMRSMIQERQYQRELNYEIKTGRVDLFFGCRHKEKDFLYGEELAKYTENGILTSLNVAFSRDQSYKIYVQAKLMHQKKTIYKALTSKAAYFFIAGSAKRMPTDVYEVLRDILCSEGNCTEKEADQYLKLLAKRKRYVVEAWS